MLKLTQNFHGIPSMGIHGRPGNKGKTGQNIYIGFINDFFDYLEIDVKNLIYYTQRYEDKSQHKITDTNYNLWLNTRPKSKNTNSSPTGIYYTGEFVSNGKNYFDNEILKYDSSGNVITKIKAPGEAINDPISGDEIDSYDYIKLNDITYIDESSNEYTYESLYDLDEDKDPETDNILGYIPKYNIKIDGSHVTYDYADLKWAAEWLLMNLNSPKEFNNQFYQHTMAIKDDKGNSLFPGRAAIVKKDGTIDTKENETLWHQPLYISDEIRFFPLYAEKEVYEKLPEYACINCTLLNIDEEKLYDNCIKAHIPANNIKIDLDDNDNILLKVFNQYYIDIFKDVLESNYGINETDYKEKVTEVPELNIQVTKKFYGAINEIKFPETTDEKILYYSLDSGGYYSTVEPLYTDVMNQKKYYGVYNINENISSANIDKTALPSYNKKYIWLTPEDVTNINENPDDPSLELLNMLFYFKLPLKLDPLYIDTETKEKTEEYTDFEGYLYWGIHPSTLFKKIERNKNIVDINGNPIGGYNTALNDFVSIYDGVRSSEDGNIYDIEDSVLLDQKKWYETYKNYEITLTSKNSLMPFNSGKPNANNVMWHTGESDNVKIPTKLSANINEGDVIYFYTEDSMNKDETIDISEDLQINNIYMVVVTKELLRCEPDELISNAITNNAFSYSIISEDNSIDRLNINSTAVITALLNGYVNSGFSDFQIRSLENILCTDDINGLKLISIDNTENANAPCNLLKLLADASNTFETNINDIPVPKTFTIIEHNNRNIFQINDESKAKKISAFNQLAIKDTNVQGNYELLNIVYDKYINFVEGDFIYDYIDQGNIEVEYDTLTKNKEGVIKNLKYTINRTDFFNESATEDIMSEYYIGYILLYKGQIFKQEDVNADTLDIVWDPLAVLSPDLLTEQVAQSYDIFGDALPFVMSKNDLDNMSEKISEYQEAYENSTSTSNSITKGELKLLDNLTTNAAKALEDTVNNVNHYEYLPFDIMFTCRKKNGFNYISNLSHVNVIIQQTPVTDVANNQFYRYDIDTFYITVDYPNSNDIDWSDASEGNIKFIFDGLTVNEETNKLLNIAVKPDIKITKITLNGSNLTILNESDESIDNSAIQDSSINTEKTNVVSYTNTPIKSNWLNINAVDNKTENINLTDYTLFQTYSINVKDNIPEIKSEGYDTIKTKHTDDYMLALADNKDNGYMSPLFALLDARRKPVSTAKRSAMLLVYYIDPLTEEEAHENFIITQPGFIDNRTLPQIDLKLTSGLEQLEEINNKDNGVLANQVRTYLDVDISKFSRNDWGLYGYDNILLDLVIKNYTYDNTDIIKYKISNPNKRSTVKFFFNDTYALAKEVALQNINAKLKNDTLTFANAKLNINTILNEAIKIESAKAADVTALVKTNYDKGNLSKNINYWKYQTYIGPIREDYKKANDIITDDEINDTDKLKEFWVNNYYALNITDFSEIKNNSENDDTNEINKTFDSSIILNVYCTAEIDAKKLDKKAIYTDNQKQYIFINNDVISAHDKTKENTAGMMHDITININNISIDDVANGKIRFAIDFEMGNPIPGILNLQFYVDSIKIKIVDKEKEIDSDDYIKATFTLTLDINDTLDSNLSLLDTGKITWINKLKSDCKEYRFLSNVFNATFNPLSLLAAPISEENNIVGMSGLVKMTGSTLPLKVKTSFYNAPLYTALPSLTNDVSDTLKRRLMFSRWSNFNLLPAYFQDNVTDIKVIPISPNSINIEKILDNFMSVYFEKYPQLLETTELTEIDSAYFNISIDANGYFNPRNREDGLTFYYDAPEVLKVDKEAGDYIETTIFLADQYNLIKNNCPIFCKVDEKLSIRSQEELDAIDMWNFEYTAYGHKEANKTFTGKNNEYGNGYLYLPDEYDIGQYEEDETLSLTTIKESLVEKWSDGENHEKLKNRNTLSNVKSSVLNKYFPETIYRTFAYDMAWEYPWVKNNSNQLNHSMIISAFDLLLLHIQMKYDAAKKGETPYELSKKYKTHLDALIQYTTGLDIEKIDTNKEDIPLMPYTYCYDISPRVAYNYDADSYNIMMLRRPVIGYDTDDIEKVENYMMQRSLLPNRDKPETYERLDKHHSYKPYDLNIIKYTSI